MIYVIYDAMLRLYERERFRSPGLREILLRDRAQMSASAIGNAERAAQVAEAFADVLAEIEEREGTPVPELSQERASYYTQELSSILDERLRAARPHRDPRRGRELLEELRRDYGRVAA
ncbi:MAG TPA: hypothetical protein VF746_27525 [Longimicrobium sp.]